MKVKSLLAIAAKCKTPEDAQNLLKAMVDALTKNKALASFLVLNEDYTYEEDKPFVTCDLIRLINNEYGVSIRPEIRSGEFTIVICLSQMLDKRGLSSNNFNTVTGMEKIIEPTDDQTLYALGKLVIESVTNFHQQLIESVGVPPLLAELCSSRTKLSTPDDICNRSNWLEVFWP